MFPEMIKALHAAEGTDSYNALLAYIPDIMDAASGRREMKMRELILLQTLITPHMSFNDLIKEEGEQ